MPQKMIEVDLEKLRAMLPTHRIIPMADLSKMDSYLYRLFTKAEAGPDELKRIFVMLQNFFTHYVADEPGPYREPKDQLIARLDALLPPCH